MKRTSLSVAVALMLAVGSLAQEQNQPAPSAPVPKVPPAVAAIATARKSIELASKDTGPAKGEYTRLNEALIASLQ
jgi:hypothetical protein